MLKITKGELAVLERDYEGISGTIEHYEQLSLPLCPRCGSADTATVSCGLVGRSMAVASATTKIKLIPNGRPGGFWCNACQTMFEASDRTTVAETWRWFEVEDRYYRATPDWETVEIWSDVTKSWESYLGDVARLVILTGLTELHGDPTPKLMTGRGISE